MTRSPTRDPVDGRLGAIEWGDPSGPTFGIAELAELSDVPPSSIHHYRRSGLLPEPARRGPHRFVYDERHVAALRAVRALRERGLSLEEVRAALHDLTDVDPRGSGLDIAVDRYLAARPAEESTDEKLIAAAVEAFARHSYREVSVADLCVRAGIAKGTFYRHFASKDELFLAAARSVVEDAIAGFCADLAAHGGENHPAILARHLRGGLPILFELAKWSLKESDTGARTAARLFADLAVRLGHTVGEDEAPRAGGMLIMLAVVEVFMDLVLAEIDDAT